MRDPTDDRLEWRRRRLEYRWQVLDKQMIQLRAEVNRVQHNIDVREADKARARRTRLLWVVGLSARVIGVLDRYGIYDPEELTAMSDKDLLAMRNFGVGALQELRAAIKPGPTNP
jgi:DNA-directed RNA polymerase alpha subunit